MFACTPEKFEPLLQRKQNRNQALQGEIEFLRKAPEPANAKRGQELQELGEDKATYDRHKEEWEAAQAAAKADGDTTKSASLLLNMLL